ncbi:MAG TPA: N-6 DNA methylase, partial [Candidatus Nanopelagicales bacterium]|nr:N-6 DNA methylase [Candidatus Nanopelagicales bacterium]
MSLPTDLEKILWTAMDRIRGSTAVHLSEWMDPVLGLIFLGYADRRFTAVEKKLASQERLRESIDREAVHALGAIHVPDSARIHRLLELPDGADLGEATNEAMRAIERENSDLKDVLPKTYGQLGPHALRDLLKLIEAIPGDVEVEAFGSIYEDLLDRFARQAGLRGAEYRTPTTITRLLVEVVQPLRGLIYDPCCGTGGMFVESASFSAAHETPPRENLQIHGAERFGQLARLAKMNLAIHGLHGDIREADTLYEDIHDQVGRFDFVLACPPFNLSLTDKNRIEKDRERFPFGMPASSANYLWIQLFYSALNGMGRAGFVMSNSASDSRDRDLDLRRQLLERGAVDTIIALSPGLFYFTSLPATLWLLDKGKAKSERRDRVLFIDAQGIYRRLSRRQRDLAPEQIEYLANVVRLYRGEKPETAHGSSKLLEEGFPRGKYVDVPGLCKAATLKEIEAQGWSLNPGQYVGVAAANAMRLRHMRLGNVYGFLDLDLTFPEGQVAVLVGANGAGKTTVLDSISMFLAPLAALLRGTDPRKTPYGLTRAAIHVDAKSAEAKLSVKAGGAEETWRLSAGLTTSRSAVDPAMTQWARRLEEALTTSETTPVPVLVYYPAVRFYLYEGYQKRRARPAELAFPQLAAYENAFEMGQQSFEGVVGWFRREEDLENEMRLGGAPEYVSPRLHGVRQAVLRFMDRLSEGVFDDLRVRRDQEDTAKARLVLRKGGMELSLDSLSE